MGTWKFKGIYRVTVELFLKEDFFNKTIVSLENWTVVPRLTVLQDISDFYISCLYKKNLEERIKSLNHYGKSFFPD